MAFEIISEKQAYSRYLSVKDRIVRHPKTNNPVAYDIVAHHANHEGWFVCVFPFNVKTVSC